MPKITDITKEHWRYVVGFGKLYAASTHGRVVSMRAGRLMKLHKCKRGHNQRYMRVMLCANGTRRPFLVHRLVLDAWCRPRKEGQQCRHLDGNSLNNRLDNLLWGSQEEDWADRIKHGRGLKLTPERVHYIRNSAKTAQELAAEFNCSEANIRMTRTGQSWAKVPGELRRKQQLKLTPERVRHIRSSNKTDRELAAEFGCATTTIKKARIGQQWAKVPVPPQRRKRV